MLYIECKFSSGLWCLSQQSQHNYPSFQSHLSLPTCRHTCTQPLMQDAHIPNLIFQCLFSSNDAHTPSTLTLAFPVISLKMYHLRLFQRPHPTSGLFWHSQANLIFPLLFRTSFLSIIFPYFSSNIVNSRTKVQPISWFSLAWESSHVFLPCLSLPTGPCKKAKSGCIV